MKTYSYKVVLEYFGTHYFGWQKQKGKKLPTIQGTLEEALRKLIGQEGFFTMASGRTDAGVHALGQIVKIDIPVPIPPENLPRALNKLLPDDIRLREASLCESSYHPIFHAKSKEYRYYFSFDKPASILENLFIQELEGNFHMDLMKRACSLFIGEHDFSHYYCEGSPVKSPVRKIFECEILKGRGLPDFVRPHLILRVRGNGFLKQMVRLMTGAIWDMGRERLSLEVLERSLKNPEKISKRHLNAVAPPKGLFLYEVET